MSMRDPGLEGECTELTGVAFGVVSVPQTDSNGSPTCQRDLPTLVAGPFAESLVMESFCNVSAEEGSKPSVTF